MLHIISGSIVNAIMPFVQKQQSEGKQPSFIQKLVNASHLPMELKQQYAYANNYGYSNKDLTFDISDLSVEMKQKLQYVYVSENTSNSNEFTEIGTKYYPNKSSGFDGGILERCKNEIDRNRRNNKPITSIDYEADNCKSSMVRIGIFNPDINKGTLNIIFKSLNTVFENDGTNERLLVAASAYALMNYLIENTPNDINKNDVIKCAAKYPTLINAGRTIAGLISI